MFILIRDSYQIDVTWDIGASDIVRRKLSYDYFLVSDKIINKEHRAEEKLPICNSMEQNYFTKNKQLFIRQHLVEEYIENALMEKKNQLYFRYEGKISRKDIV